MLNSLMRQAEIDRYWAAFLNCDVEKLYTYGTAVTFTPNSPGIFVLQTPASRLIAIHPALGIPIEQLTNMLEDEKMVSKVDITKVLTPHYEPYETFGPGPLSYLNADDFQRVDEMGCRILSADDASAIQIFETMAGWQENQAGQVKSRSVASLGIHQGSRLVAMCRVYDWAGVIGAMKAMVLTEYRGGGFGRAVIGAATRWMLEESNLIPQHDTDFDNHRSAYIAKQLGYRHYGHMSYGKVTL